MEKLYGLQTRMFGPFMWLNYMEQHMGKFPGVSTYNQIKEIYDKIEVPHFKAGYQFRIVEVDRNTENLDIINVLDIKTIH